MFYVFSSVKCGTSGILPVSPRQQNEVDDFSKSTSRLKSTNRDSSTLYLIMLKVQGSLLLVTYTIIQGIISSEM